MAAPIVGFAPDAAWGDPSSLTNCTAMLPYDNGLEAAPAWASAGASALSAACQGAALIYKLDGTSRLIAGTATKLYEIDGAGTAWTDRSRSGDYTSSIGRWSIIQFGDTTLACNFADRIQSSTTGAFADITVNLKAKILVAALSSGGGFCLAFNTVDVSNGAQQDRWYCSAINSATDWTVAAATQCNTGRLLGYQGAITAATNLTGDTVLVTKAQSIYVGRYVGPPAVWSFQEIPGVGCVGQEAICNVGNSAFFVGNEGFYLFDGASVQRIGDGVVRRWWQDNSAPLYRYRTICQYDTTTRRVFVRYVSSGNTGNPDSCLVYHVPTQRWGRDDVTLEAGVQYVTPATSWDSLVGTWDSQSNNWDSVAWAAGTETRGYFNSSHTLYIAAGTPTTSTMTTGAAGSDGDVSRLTTCKVRYDQAPTAASISVGGYMQSAGVSGTPDSRSAYDAPSGALHSFPVRTSGRWHKATFTFTGSCRVNGVEFELNSAGKR